MQIDSQVLEGGAVKINLSGRMDIQGAQDIDLKLSGMTASQRAVIVDMSAVNFLASIGIRSLLMVAKAVNSRGGKVVLFNPDETVTKILEMAGIDTLIPISRSLDDARQLVAV